MEQGLNLNKNVAVIGAGPAGALCAILLSRFTDLNIVIFDNKPLLHSILPTGGGRCNLSYYEPDIKELVKNYPRGEKFLLSLFSKFNVFDTISLFEELGIKTYVQDDLRIFPKAESSKKVADILIRHIEKSSIVFQNEKVSSVQKEKDSFGVATEKSHYKFDYVILATGGRGNGFDIAKALGHKIEPLRPSLAPLGIREKEFYLLSGLTLKDIWADVYFKNSKLFTTCGDLLFAHKSITGPLVFKVSSLAAYLDFSDSEPLVLKMNISNLSEEELTQFIEDNIKSHPHKTIINTFSKLINKNLLNIILKNNNIDSEKQIVHINKREKAVLIRGLNAFELNLTARVNGGEIVTAGGVSLDEINPKTMESKILKGLYLIGEVINVDGFTGGFNLQNCWSCAYVCAKGLSVS